MDRKELEKVVVRSESRMDRTWASLRDMNDEIGNLIVKLDPSKTNTEKITALDLQIIQLCLKVISTENSMRSLRRLMEEMD